MNGVPQGTQENTCRNWGEYMWIVIGYYLFCKKNDSRVFFLRPDGAWISICTLSPGLKPRAELYRPSGTWFVIGAYFSCTSGWVLPSLRDCFILRYDISLILSAYENLTKSLFQNPIFSRSNMAKIPVFWEIMGYLWTNYCKIPWKEFFFLFRVFFIWLFQCGRIYYLFEKKYN